MFAAAVSSGTIEIFFITIYIYIYIRGPRPYFKLLILIHKIVYKYLILLEYVQYLDIY